MLYRKMKSTGDELSILGFGCMRLPEKNGKIDEERAAKQLHYAIDHGVNYLDTAVPYHMGASEPFLGKALADGYREKVKLATKMPHWHVKSRDDMDRFLKLQLDNLRTDHVDYYLIHNMNGSSWKRLKELGLTDFIAKAKADGRIKHIGFSAHTGKKDFKEIVDDYNWEFCQIQYNILDEKSQAGTEGLEYATSKGLGVIIMEPLRGGSLARAPSDVQTIWDEAPIKRTPAEWAFRWIWNRPEVTVVLSGMNDERHIEENLKIASETLPGSLSELELNLIDRATDAYRKLMKVGCTGCRYCMPCPKGVDIPGCFESYNNKYLGGSAYPGNPQLGYAIMVGGSLGKKPGYASQCKECNKCAKACPQHIPIPNRLKEVKREFEGPTFPVMKLVVGGFMRYDRWRNLRKART
ncbi:MAG TPA: aldo/keto reductase [Methanocella sp.]|nr:aldo/keto reductase [Methanocella sp.]